MAKEKKYTRMELFMKEIFQKIRNMGTANLSLLTRPIMKGSLEMIKSPAMVK